jgi:hypothetical protein
MPISGAKRVVCVVDVDAGKIYVGMVPLASGGVFDDRPPRSGIECGWIQSDPLVVLQGGMHAGRGEQHAGLRGHSGGHLLGKAPWISSALASMEPYVEVG